MQDSSVASYIKLRDCKFHYEDNLDKDKLNLLSI